MLAVSGARRRTRAARDQDLSLAWHIEALARTKRLPRLAALLAGVPSPPTPDQVEQSRSDFDEIVAQMERT